MDSMWDIAGVCFAPNIEYPWAFIGIAKLSQEGVSRVYALLRRRSRLNGLTPICWSLAQGKDLLVDSVPDAAKLVAVGDAEAFYHHIEGLIAGGVELPVLGVYVWPECVELEYRMGHEWGPAQVAGFFELLWDCCSLDPGAVVVPDECEGPLHPDQFLKAWASYKERAEPDSRRSGLS